MTSDGQLSSEDRRFADEIAHAVAQHMAENPHATCPLGLSQKDVTGLKDFIEAWTGAKKTAFSFLIKVFITAGLIALALLGSSKLGDWLKP
jgi:hypothetical protein